MPHVFVVVTKKLACDRRIVGHVGNLNVTGHSEAEFDSGDDSQMMVVRRKERLIPLQPEVAARGSLMIHTIEGIYSSTMQTGCKGRKRI